MKRAVSILCVAVLLISMLALTACGSNINGTYKMVSMSMSGASVDPGALGIEITLTVDGNKATMSGMSALSGDSKDSQELTVDTKEKVFSSGTSDVPYTIEGKTLTLEKDGTKMVFEKQ